MTASLRETLETHQVVIYFLTILIAGVGSLIVPTTGLSAFIEPALALMLFLTFLQVPLAALRKTLLQVRFLVALALSNFVAVPVLVALILPLAPSDPLVRLGVLMVLLTPCIDYVVTFSQIGRANSQSLLAATPMLLASQMLLLPVYLGLFLGDRAADLVALGPFLKAFLWLIVVPLLLAALVQFGARQRTEIRRLKAGLDRLPVLSTALVLGLVFAGVVPQLGLAAPNALSVIPIYATFAVAAPAVGWTIGRLMQLSASDGRAVAFSTATRNSLVVLPLAFAVPGAMPLLPAVIVAQTLIELIASLIYMKLMPVLGSTARPPASTDKSH